MPPETQKKELSNGIIALMVTVAFFYDVLQIALSWIGVGFLIIPFFYLHFWLWFRLRGVKFISLKRASTLSIGAALEFLTAGIIPGVSFFFFLNASVYKI